jgi:DNA-directed RNA polymerase specialized sigma24 family protein
VHRVEVVAKQGASEAEIAEIYRHRFSGFLRLGYALLGDSERARDAVQETFVAALGTRASFRGEGSLDGWLWRTMLCRRAWRVV